MQLGKHECRLLLFLIRYGNGKEAWHTIHRDTLPAARRLASKGFIVLNEHNQARLKVELTSDDN